MIKVLAVLAVLCGISAGYSIPIPSGFMYFQQPMGPMSPRQAIHGTYFQNQQLRNRGRSAGVTYLNDVEGADLPAQDQNVQSVAEAYPEEQFPQEYVPQDDQFPVEDVYQQDVPAVQEVEAEEPIADVPTAAAAPVVPAVNPAKKNKKKVTAQLDSDEEEEQDARVSSRGASRAAAPSVHFPVNFGSNNGATIAISNSYSTGKGGSAVSTATAYGSPATEELRKAARAQLKRRPAKLRVGQY